MLSFAQLARTNTQPRLWRKCPTLPPHTASCLRGLTHRVLHFLCRLQERKGKRVRTEGSNLEAEEMDGVDAMEPAALKAWEEEEDSDDEEEFMVQMQQNAMQSLTKPAGEPDKFEVASPDKGKIAVGMTVYVMATKIGGLSKDNIVAVIGEASQGKPTFLTYLEKPAEREEVKAAAMIMSRGVIARRPDGSVPQLHRPNLWHAASRVHRPPSASP